MRRPTTLSEEPLPPAPPADAAALVAQALRERPDVVAERLSRESSAKFADAERALWFPTVSADRRRRPHAVPAGRPEPQLCGDWRQRQRAAH